MNPTTSKLLQPIKTIAAVAPKIKSIPLRKSKTMKKSGILKKNQKKRKMTPSKQKAVANTAENIIFSIHNCP